MKKMQCEICGGTTIKKIGENTFQCQSCGIEYSNEEVKKLLVEITGTVKLNRTEEIDNTLRRGEQFYEKGETEKAEQYYNRALDMDPDNPQATARLKEIESSEVLENHFVIERNLSAEEGKLRFLRSLQSQEEIVPDIYRELKIVSVEEGYYPLLLRTGTYQGNYSGTACFYVQVPYTDYENQNVRMSNGEYRTERVPVTKYRTEVDRRPASGTYSTDVTRLFCVSEILLNKLRPSYKEEFSIADNEKVDRYMRFSGYEGKGLVSMLERYFARGGLERPNNEPLPASCATPINGHYLYRGIPIELEGLRSRIQASEDEYGGLVNKWCEVECKNRISGDFTENCRYDVQAVEETRQLWYVPLQIVKYSFRNRSYLAVVILNKEIGGVAMTYPMFKNRVDISDKINAEIDRIYNSKFSSFWVPIITIVGIFAGWVFSGFPDGFGVLALIGALGGVVGTIICFLINKSKDEKIDLLRQKLKEEMDRLGSLNAKVLGTTAEAFFKVYEQQGSVEKAVAAAFAAHSHSSDSQEIQSYGSGFTKNYERGRNRKSRSAADRCAPPLATAENTEGQTIVLEALGTDKIEIIRILRDELGWSLEQAKRCVNTVPQIISLTDRAKADCLAAALSHAGAQVKRSG